jgi:hypothetical protein
MATELFGLVGAVILLTLRSALGNGRERRRSTVAGARSAPTLATSTNVPTYTVLCVHCPRQEPTYWQSEWVRHGCPCRFPYQTSEV